MCPLCKSKNHKLIGVPKLDEKSKKILTENYEVVQCTECQFYYVKPEIKINEAGWRYLYNDEYFNDYTTWHERSRRKDRQQRIKKLERLLKNKVENFLDIGCGEGLMLVEGLNSGWNVFGVDIADNRIEIAKKKEIKFEKTDLLNAKLPENYFDCVYCDSVLEHILNPMEYLLEINRILKPGGIVYIGVPNEDYLLNDMKKIFNNLSGNKSVSAKLKPFVSPYHIGGFNKNSLKYALSNSSFKIEILRNFATRLVFIYVKFLSKAFFKSIVKSLIYLVSVPFRKEYYLEVYAVKE